MVKLSGRKLKLEFFFNIYSLLQPKDLLNLRYLILKCNYEFSVVLALFSDYLIDFRVQTFEFLD